ncbi:ExeM/NucH family extracellular endonuclease [Rheinheimera maricola]|uniref:ExeM/NucH family extracellular endonuclease n=1 Tax=Rheinheimera maricola TaxID=2793282 RepID=A0ABS7X8A5_9GAMM|nr:ExeM/NucH family extracellular endonuclease [Rheinheimera maricola]MBZ9611414.1 ExeM/NucH family extracellular endonuclease [Rheinheimera maricola]
MCYNGISLALLAVLIISSPAAASCSTEFSSINTIQGSSDISPLLGQQVNTQGVVTAIIYPDSKAAGIVLRAPNTTSLNEANSLFIADREAAGIYSPGQLLQVSGTVTELQQLTSLAQITAINLCGDDANTAAIPLSLPLAAGLDWEQLEGALLSIDQTLIVNDTYSLSRFGEITLADQRLMVPTEIMAPGEAAAKLNDTQQQRHMLVLDDGKYQQNPQPLQVGNISVSATNTVRVGDAVSQIKGVLLQDDRGYRLVPTVQPQFTRANPRPEKPASKPTRALRVASFNVLNYFNGEGQIPAFPTRRGANSPAEFQRQQAKTVAALAALDADIIGLLEVENNGYSVNGALADLTRALNKVVSKPYRYVITDEQPGTDQIKVALLYRPSTVNVEGHAAMLLGPPFDWGSRPPLAQSFRHLASNQLVTVSINHFKSKGSCPEDTSDVNADQHDGQACWNALRTQSAKALSDWLHSQPTGVETDKQLILGDLNAYRMEDPLRALEQQQWHYLSAASGTTYSYVYRGRSGSLDHVLASPALAKQLAGIQHWAINADEPTLLDYNTEFKSDAQQQLFYAPSPYRSSDHDPVLATFQF